MSGRKEHNDFIIEAKIYVAVSACSLRFLFLFFLFPSCIFGFEMKCDTAKKYELNDPRNPDCPCHKYQKLAEEEYRKAHDISNDQEFKNTKAAISHSEKTYSALWQQRIVKKDSSEMNFIKRWKTISAARKMKIWIVKNRKKIKMKTKIKKKHDDYSVCFKWH
jgi:hypothetical protein